MTVRFRGDAVGCGDELEGASVAGTDEGVRDLAGVVAGRPAVVLEHG